MDYSQTQLNEIICRDWAVRVLDAYELPYYCLPGGIGAGLRKGEPDNVVCVVRQRAEDPQLAGWDGGMPLGFEAKTRDAARLAAAETVWPELPESVRAELGERP